MRGADLLRTHPRLAAALMSLQARQPLQPQCVGAIEGEGEHAIAQRHARNRAEMSGRPVQARESVGTGDPQGAVLVEPHRRQVADAQPVTGA